MENITSIFNDYYQPVKGLVFRRNTSEDQGNHYIESFDFSETGYPINFHPLTESESAALAETIFIRDSRLSFLNVEGIIPDNVLHINTGVSGFAVWHTKPRKAPLLFKEILGIPCGQAYIPPLLWRADKKSLQLYALDSKKRPSLESRLYHAPFFNINPDGWVCMGDVKIAIEPDCNLQDFMAKWEKYFFGSYFTHLLMAKSPVSVNIVQLWKDLVTNKKSFPMHVLLPSSETVKNIVT